MSNRTIKFIAAISMLYDHLLRIFPAEKVLFPLQEWLNGRFPLYTGFWSGLIDVLSTLSFCVGRLAAPLFMFCIAVGYVHTRNVKKYIGRLAVFALISQLPYALIFGVAEPRMYGMEPDPWGQDLNFLFTLCLGLVDLWLFDSLRQKYHVAWGVLAAAGMAGAARFLPVEGGMQTILMIFFFYSMRGLPKLWQGVLWTVLLPLTRWSLLVWLIHDFSNPSTRSTVLLNLAGVYVGILLSLTYNGERGRISRPLQYGFYWFYPAHLLVLGIIGLFTPVLIG